MNHEKKKLHLWKKEVLKIKIHQTIMMRREKWKWVKTRFQRLLRAIAK